MIGEKFLKNNFFKGTTTGQNNILHSLKYQNPEYQNRIQSTG